MGYLKHHTIIVTSWRTEDINIVRNKALEIFSKEDYAESLVSDIINGIVNNQNSFFIAPDGSKEGWDTSNSLDDLRKEFIEYLKYSSERCDFVEVIFGGDSDYSQIINSNNEIL